MSVLSPDRNFVVQAGSLVLHGEFPSPRQETEIEIKVRRRLGGLSDDVLDPDVVGRERIMCELEVAVTHASDPDFLPALRGEGLPSDALLVAAWDPYVKAKKEHVAAEEKKIRARYGLTDARKHDSRSVSVPPDGATAGESGSAGPVPAAETVSGDGTQPAGELRGDRGPRADAAPAPRAEIVPGP